MTRSIDDGSSNYQIYNNLLLKGGLKFREGYGRKAWNYVLVNCGFHPHVWLGDSASEFRQNIVMAAHAPIGMPAAWGASVDGIPELPDGPLRRPEASAQGSGQGACDTQRVGTDRGRR
jgi:hypothetical protein